MTTKEQHQNKQLFETFTKIDKPYGTTYGGWTGKWWQWLLSIPWSKSPLNDETGEYWNTAQPSADVWLLAGKFGSIDKTPPHRNVKMESGRSILFPVLNCSANSLEYPELKTEEDLIRHVTYDVGTVVKKNCLIDGISVTPSRISSDPSIFPVVMDKDNPFGVNGGGSTLAAADGYWVFLKQLGKGHHTIEFEGSCESGRLNAGAIYELEIT